MAKANQLTPEYKEFIELLNANKVEYLVVGAYAVARYGYVRATGDIDIWINPTEANAHRIIESLEQFGFGGLGYTKNDFILPDIIVQLGVAPLRIDLLTSIDGVTFSECFPFSETRILDETPINFIGLNELRRNKASTGRLKDRLDLERLADEDL